MRPNARLEHPEVAQPAGVEQCFGVDDSTPQRGAVHGVTATNGIELGNP
jgi:hypothetical protein